MIHFKRFPRASGVIYAPALLSHINWHQQPRETPRRWIIRLERKRRARDSYGPRIGRHGQYLRERAASMGM